MKITKRIIYVFILTFLFVLAMSYSRVEAAQLLSEPETIKGTIVNYTSITTDLSAYEVNNYLADENHYVRKGAIKLANPTNRYNSHSYAWYNQDFVNNQYIINDNEVLKYINDGSYQESLGNVGDILCYWRIRLEYSDEEKTSLVKGEVYLANSAIIKSVDGTFNADDLTTLSNLTVVSKWGNGGLYEHKGNNTPYYYDSIHGSTPIDKLHFDYVESSKIDDALFYVKAYTPKVHQNVVIDGSDKVLNSLPQEDGYNLYKIKVNSLGSYQFMDQTSKETEYKLYDFHMNLIKEITSDSTGVLNFDEILKLGAYYLKVSFKDENSSGYIKTSIKKNPSMGGIILADIDSQKTGSEVSLNNGLVDGDNITEGFSRFLYISGDAPSTSRLDYYWYSSNESVATVTEFGTVLAINGKGNRKVTITAIYKKDKRISYTKEFEILEEVKTYDEAPINVYGEMHVTLGKSQLLVLPSNAPYNYNQYYSWTSDNLGILSVSSYGTLYPLQRGTATITGLYKYNNRVRVIINVIVE